MKCQHVHPYGKDSRSRSELDLACGPNYQSVDFRESKSTILRELSLRDATGMARIYRNFFFERLCSS